MSFLAKLIVDGREYNILGCTYNFDQPMDATGKPAGKPQGGRIMATIEADGSYDLLHWMTSPDQTKDGSLVYYKRDAMSRLQEVIFKKAYCVSLETEFDALDDSPLQNHIVISAKSLHIGDMKFDNSWGD
ncbi:type VI secretion system tube protein TssD [Pricia sp. S334]|uniref:Type VI secretion system tube protein TssD n=1 Tax=Pricia mediterranea TaxID=3076079 RepID=A0ABU3L5H9_9FLAO|nr:type VI secretion system tube protein TssD [Pricia sp. S334]MDT7828474.1 type VI secretion system tube protein TssD [Pricia sp. S334]